MEPSYSEFVEALGNRTLSTGAALEAEDYFCARLSREAMISSTRDFAKSVAYIDAVPEVYNSLSCFDGFKSSCIYADPALQHAAETVRKVVSHIERRIYAYVLRIGATVYVVFPPTVSAVQWLANFDAVPTQATFVAPWASGHHGFVLMTGSLARELDVYIRSSFVTRVVITGMSLGGAMAETYAAYRYIRRNDRRTRLVTFGAPRVFSMETCCRIAQEIWTGTAVSYIKTRDMVSALPLDSPPIVQWGRFGEARKAKDDGHLIPHGRFFGIDYTEYAIVANMVSWILRSGWGHGE